MSRDSIITHSKRKFYNIYSKLIIPDIMFDDDFNSEEIKSFDDKKIFNPITIDITIKYITKINIIFIDIQDLS